MTRKRRTRKHIIADFAANHFEYKALLCNYSVEKVEHDYGVDLNLYTYSPMGEVENGWILVQLKSTDNPKYSVDDTYISHRVKKADLESWIPEGLPVILVVYDAKIEKAYWLYIQRHFESEEGFNLAEIRNTYTIKIGTNQVVGETAIMKFTSFKNEVLDQINGVITHVQVT